MSAPEFSISGWIIIYDTNDQQYTYIVKCIKSFIKAFSAQDSPHRNSIGLVSDPNGVLVNKAYIAFHYKGTYQNCHSFRTALHAFCSVYCLTLDRGDEIVALQS